MSMSLLQERGQPSMAVTWRLTMLWMLILLRDMERAVPLTQSLELKPRKKSGQQSLPTHRNRTIITGPRWFPIPQFKVLVCCLLGGYMNVQIGHCACTVRYAEDIGSLPEVKQQSASQLTGVIAACVVYYWGYYETDENYLQYLFEELCR